MSKKHTPGKWEVIHGTYPYIVATSKHKTTAICAIAGGISAEEATANALHIARCVNSHDALIDALEMIRDADDDCARDGLPTIPAPARAKIDAAIAAAESN